MSEPNTTRTPEAAASAQEPLTAGTVLEPVAPPAEGQLLRVVTDVWGSQRCRVSAHAGRVRDRHVTLTLGRVLLYLHDRRALETFADAWADASVMAEKMRLPGADRSRTGWPQDPAYVAVSAHLHLAQSWRLTGVGGAASPNGHAHLSLTLGRMSFHVYDRDALASVTDAVTVALDAGSVFGPATPVFTALRQARSARLP